MCTTNNQVRTYKNARDIFDEFQIIYSLRLLLVYQ